MRGSLSRVVLIELEWLLNKGSKDFLRRTCVQGHCRKHSGTSIRQKPL